MKHCENLKRKQEAQEQQGQRRSRNKYKDKQKANLSRSRQQEDDTSSSDSESGFCALGEHALATVTEEEKKKWLVDSGATKHMGNDKKQFDKLTPLEKPEKIKVGDGYYVESTMQGNVKLNLNVDGKDKTITLRNVLYVPDLSYNLLSVAKATDSGKQVTFDDNGCDIKVKRTGKILLQAVKRRSLYYVNTSTKEKKVTQYAYSMETPEPISNERLWHSRYGHLGDQSLTKLVKDDMVSGLEYKESFTKDEKGFCEPCAQGKQQHKKFPRDESTRAVIVFDLVHTDVCGKMDVPSLSGCEYFISFIDDKSRYAWTYPI